MAKKVTYKIDVKTGEAEKNVKGLNKGLDKTGKSAKDASQKGKGLGGVFDKMGISIKALGIGALVSGLAAVGGVFVSAFKKGNEFGKTLSGLKAVSGATNTEMKKLSDSAKKLGASTAFSATQVVELQTEFAKLGFTTDQILNMTSATLDLAASLEVSLSEAAMLSGSTLRQFGLEAEDTQRVVDVLSMSTTKSALDFAGLQESLKLAGPVAKATNVSLEETTALLGTLANGGLKGSIAGTGLAKTFIMLGKKGITLEDALETVNTTMETSATSTNKLNKAVELVGIVGAKSLITLASNADDIDVLKESLDAAGGAAKSIADTRLDNLAGDTTALSSAWEGFLLSIEDGEGIFSSIARGIVQATTALVQFITPTIRVSDALADERIELFKVQAQLQDVNTTQEDRVAIINELQKQYPDYLENIDAEKASNEELNTVIEKINSNLINKITIQKKEEEILEQAEEAAEALNERIEKRDKVREKSAELRAFLTEKEIKLNSKNAEELLKEIDKIIESQNKLRLEGGKTVIKNFNSLRKEQTRLKVLIEESKDAEEEFNEEQKKTGVLTAEKQALMEELGMTTEENTEKKEIDIAATEAQINANFSLIKQLEDEIKTKKEKMPEATKKQIKDKNIVINKLQEELKALRSLGVEQKKQSKQVKKNAEDEAKDLEELEKLKQKLLNEEIEREDQQFNLLQELRNTEQEQEIFKLMQQYDKKFELAQDNAELEKALEEQQGIDIAAINKKYEDKRVADNEKANKEIQDNANKLRDQRLSIAADALSAISDIANAFAKDDEESAKRAFNVNKAAGIGQAIISTAQGIINAYANPVDVASGIAFAKSAVIGATGAAQIATIASQKFESAGSPPQETPETLASTSQPPSFNVVGASGFNQIAGALGQQGPVQAFVVGSQVTTQQQLDNNIVATATL